MPTLVLTLLLALGATDPETTFNEAYVMEVVEGNVADAARLYLQVMESDAAPAALRLRAKFRFGVACVLLGRADEARAKFAEVLADPESPAPLKARVEEYAKAVREIQVGTQLDKKLEEMVFELGRANLGLEDSGMEPTPKVYRDFAIIGKPAVPLLTRLLDHPDRMLRQHAFRLLCRMGEPGMVARYDPKVHTSMSLTRDLAGYVRSRPKEREALLTKLLAQDDEVLDSAVGRLRVSYNFPPLPLDFLREMVRRGLAVEASHWAGGDDARTLYAEWLDSGDETLRRLAAQRLLSWKPEFAEGLVTPERFPGLLVDVVESGQRIDIAGVGRQARALPPAAVLDALAAMLELGQQDLVELLAKVLDAADTGTADLARYAELLKEWLTAALAKKPSSIRNLEKHLHHVLHHLPPEEARKLAVWFVLPHAPARFRGAFLEGFQVERPEDVETLMAAWRAAPPGKPKESVAKSLPIFRYSDGGAELTPDIRAAQAHALPEILKELDGTWLSTINARMPVFLSSLPPELAVETMVDAVSASPEAIVVIRGRGWGEPRDTEYQVRVVLRGVPRLWENGDEARRGFLLHHLIGLARLDPGPARAKVSDFLRQHLDALNDSQWKALLTTDLLPLEELAPKAPPSVWNALGNRLDTTRAEAAAKVLLADPATVNESVVRLVRRLQSVGTHYDRLLVEAPTPVVETVVWQLMLQNGFPASTAAVEKAYLRLMEDEKADLWALARLGRILAHQKPTEALFPLVRRLLTQGDRDLLYKGMEIAGRLGREDLIPDLVPHLESMDEGIRSQARETIDSIMEVKRIRKEAEKLIEEK